MCLPTDLSATRMSDRSSIEVMTMAIAADDMMLMSRHKESIASSISYHRESPDERRREQPNIQYDQVTTACIVIDIMTVCIP